VAAREHDAAAVVFGQAQLMGKEIRLTGQVVDAATGKSFGSLKATGPVEDLFRLEDTLTRQAVEALPDTLLNLRGISLAREANPPRMIYLPGDAQTATFSTGPIDGPSYPSTASPFLPPAPGGTPPYSPNAGSYPYRFSYPYTHLFTYDDDPNPFLPPFTGAFYDRSVAHWHGPAAEHSGRRR
jgi:hypothetical protein